MRTRIPAGRSVHVGEQVTDYLSGRTYIVTAQDGDTTCERCGGLVRNWTCHTLVNPSCRRGAEVYTEHTESHHMLSNGLLGICPDAAREGTR